MKKPYCKRKKLKKENQQVVNLKTKRMSNSKMDKMAKNEENGNQEEIEAALLEANIEEEDSSRLEVDLIEGIKKSVLTADLQQLKMVKKSATTTKGANLKHTMIITMMAHSNLEEEEVVVDTMITKDTNHKDGAKKTPMQMEMKKVVLVKQQTERLPNIAEEDHGEDTEEQAIEGEETEVEEENLEDEVREAHTAAEVIEVVAVVVAVVEVEEDTINRKKRYSINRQEKSIQSQLMMQSARTADQFLLQQKRNNSSMKGLIQPLSASKGS